MEGQKEKKGGLFITLEGPDGSGKSTQRSLLANYLLTKGYEVLSTREPGGTRISESIRMILLNPEYKEMHPLTELLLFAAGRVQHTKEIIIPALRAGKIVISERYFDASIVYQGYGRGLDLKIVKTINQIATQGIKPDLTLILDIEPGLGLTRVGQRSSKDRLEKLSLEFHDRERRGYLALAKEEPERIKVIDASGSAEEVQIRIRKVVEDVLSQRSLWQRE